MNITRWGLLIFFLLGLFSSNLAQNATSSPVGKWKTIDDNTGKQRSIVEIYMKEGKLYGKVLQTFPEEGDDPDPKCTECSDDDPRKDQPVIGMEIMQGLVKKGKRWEDGRILDPENGSVYDCYLELEKADKLKLRGYIGFSLLGRTQYWYRTE